MSDNHAGWSGKFKTYRSSSIVVPAVFALLTLLGLAVSLKPIWDGSPDYLNLVLIGLFVIALVLESVHILMHPLSFWRLRHPFASESTVAFDRIRKRFTQQERICYWLEVTVLHHRYGKKRFTGFNLNSSLDLYTKNVTITPEGIVQVREYHRGSFKGNGPWNGVRSIAYGGSEIDDVQFKVSQVAIHPAREGSPRPSVEWVGDRAVEIKAVLDVLQNDSDNVTPENRNFEFLVQWDWPAATRHEGWETIVYPITMSYASVKEMQSKVQFPRTARDVILAFYDFSTGKCDEAPIKPRPQSDVTDAWSFAFTGVKRNCLYFLLYQLEPKQNQNARPSEQQNG